MTCNVMMRLIQKLDMVRAEQCDCSQKMNEVLKKRRLWLIEAFLDSHERTCAICLKMNPGGTQFVAQSMRRKL